MLAFWGWSQKLGKQSEMETDIFAGNHKQPEQSFGPVQQSH
jgi:hypothetical protein